MPGGAVCVRAAELFPDWPEERRTAFYMDKEQRFRDMAGVCRVGSGGCADCDHKQSANMQGLGLYVVQCAGGAWLPG